MCTSSACLMQTRILVLFCQSPQVLAKRTKHAHMRYKSDSAACSWCILDYSNAGDTFFLQSSIKLLQKRYNKRKSIFTSAVIEKNERSISKEEVLHFKISPGILLHDIFSRIYNSSNIDNFPGKIFNG